MGKIWFVVVLLLGLVAVQFANSLGGHSNVQAANDLLELAEEKNWDIDEWQFLIRDEQGIILDRGAFEQHVHIVSKELDGWELTAFDTSEQEWKAVLTHQVPDTDMQETISLFAYPQQGQNQLSHTYTLQGSYAHTLSSKQLEPLLDKRIDFFSLNEATVYTQIKSSQNSISFENGKPLPDVANDLLQTLHAETVEALQEESFVSFSGYLKDWDQAITTNNQDMNLQLAIRQEEGLGSRTTVTIGTPIITTEY